MKNIKNLIKTLFVGMLLVVSSCDKDTYEFGEIIAPSNLEITVDIVGLNAENPYGDGSGTVHFNASSSNVIGYKFIYNGTETAAPSGKMTYSFSVTGQNKYTVTVVAIGTAGVTTSKSVEVEVLTLYSPPADLLEMLTSNSSRTWRIKSEQDKHFGLGPVGGTIPFEWYGAGAGEKSETGMYDDTFTFTSDGTFTHNTGLDGNVFGRVDLIDELAGPGGTLNGADVENYPYPTYDGVWSLSAPGGAETISLTGTSFIAYYTGGNHNYQIFSRSANEMTIKTTDGNGEFDWWFTLVPVDE